MSNAWIFSSNPEKYDLLAEIEAGEVRLGAEDSWQANQRRRDMRPGDIVYHWVTGAQAGIYAISRIVSEPYAAEFPNWPDHRWWVNLRYDRVLSHPLLKADLEAHPALKDLAILRVPRQTNYLLTPKQARALQLLVRRNTPMMINETLLQGWIARFRAVWERDRREEPKGYTLLTHADEHRRQEERAQRLLTMERIPNLTAEDLRELLKGTDALSFWRDRDGRLDKILTDEGVERIRDALFSLIATAERGLTPDDFRRAINAMRGLGVLAVSEFLTHRFPDRYWIYSPNVTLTAFQELGLDVKVALPRGQKNDDHIYIALQEPMDQVVAALRDCGFPETNYHFADLFLKFVEEKSKQGRLQRIWKISAGRGGRVWPEFRDHSIVGIGFTQVKVDPREFESLEAMKVAARQVAEEKVSHEAVAQIWIFAQEMSIGDIVVAYGNKTVLGIGVITGEYVHSHDKPFPFGRQRTVRWMDLTPRATSAFSPELRSTLSQNITIIELTAEQLAEIQGSYPSSSPMSSLSGYLSASGFHFPDHLLTTYYLSLQTKPFAILTGISGTGKTKLNWRNCSPSG